MKPPCIYYGGKATVAPRIAAMLPPHVHYVEPFAGALAVLLAKPRSSMETASDLDGDLVHFWRMLRERPEELIRACALTPHSRAELEQSYSLDGCDDVERARRIWVRISQGRTGTLRKTGWRHYIKPSSWTMSMPEQLARFVERMAAVAERLRDVSLECRDGIKIAEAYGCQPDVLLYCDPPYFGDRDRNYRREMTGEGQHRALADVLLSARAAVVLSGYRSPLYDELYAEWAQVEFRTTTTQGGPQFARTEVVWSNRPLGRQGELFGEASA